MDSSNGLHVNTSAVVNRLPEYEEFMKTLHTNADKLLDHVPSDSVLNIDVEAHANGYRVAMQLASSALKMEETAEAQSPFVALEKAFLNARDTIQMWSVNRTVVTKEGLT